MSPSFRRSLRRPVQILPLAIGAAKWSRLHKGHLKDRSNAIADSEEKEVEIMQRAVGSER